MPKLFYMPFYTGEWLHDPKLRLCSPATKGVWIDLIAAMWENDQSGIVSGTVRQISRLCGDDTESVLEAIRELQQNDVANITPDLFSATSDTHIQVVSRRMSSQKELRIARNKTKGITIDLNISDPDLKKIDFDTFYAQYPRKEGRKKGKAIFDRDITTVDAYERITKALANYLRKIEIEKIQPGYYMHFSTFMGNWEDYEAYEAPKAATAPTPVSTMKHIRDIPFVDRYDDADDE